MGATQAQPLLENRLDIHDRKQFELKLEYQPSGDDPDSEYYLDAFIFLPSSLNMTQDTWPRDDFYADLHNYVRLKTPTLSFDELLRSELSPLAQLEQRVALGLLGPESEVVYDAKMLSCIFRGGLRRFAKGMHERCTSLAAGKEGPGSSHPAEQELDQLAETSVQSVKDVLRRYRAAVRALIDKYPLDEKTRVSMRLVDEYLSLTVEQFFRKTVVQMDQMPRTGIYAELRKELMSMVIDEEDYRRENQLRSIISPTGDNEEYTHRIGLLKKFCMNILFLKVQRSSGRRNWEEAIFALAAGLAMAFATGVAFLAQSRVPQVSLNFAVILVVGYMFKDRIKEGARRILSLYMSRFLPDRTTRIVDPVTREDVGVCQEKVDYAGAVKVPEEIVRMRRTDDFIAVGLGEVSESVIRYQKKIVLDSEMLPRLGDGFVTGVTDIIRLNVDRMLRDMDDPESALEYVDLEDFTVGKVKAAKSYQVDLAFRFTVDDGDHRSSKFQLVRLVLDRNGIKRMLRFDAPRPVVPV
ncbi:MAG: hypothetical protein IPJ65_18260 [Archangiaceae bacterium]|nr:hypothetical protein [Archangiaceae bacterium]